jgi:protein RecA
MARKVRKEVGQATSIRELQAMLNKKYGAGTIIQGSDAKALKIEYYSTGSFAMDVMLRGGYPYNRMVEIIGGESSCKTSAMHIASTRFLEDNPKGLVVHVDLENSVDFVWMQKLGCKLGKGSRFMFAYADSGEQAGSVICDILAQHEMPMLVIVDSIMALVPLIEITSEMDQQLMGKQPALVNRIIRIAGSRMKQAKVGQCARTSLLLINQSRDEIGATQYQFTAGFSSGGSGRKFFSGVRIVFSSSTAEKEERGTAGTNKHTTKFGKRIHVNVIKNKCGGPEETGHFIFFNRKREGMPYGFDDGEAMVAYGLLYEVLHKKGNFVYYGKRQLGNCMDKAMAFLRMPEHADVIADLKAEILQESCDDFHGVNVEEAEEKKKARKTGEIKIKAPVKKGASRSAGKHVCFATKGKKATGKRK